MKIEAGMYVRTNTGYIDKIICIFEDKNKVGLENYKDEYKGIMPIENISKFSFNLINLIEPGDIIETTKDEFFKVVAVGSDCVYINNFEEFITVDFIKSINSKEKFNKDKYEIEKFERKN